MSLKIPFHFEKFVSIVHARIDFFSKSISNVSFFINFLDQSAIIFHCFISQPLFTSTRILSSDWDTIPEFSFKPFFVSDVFERVSKHIKSKSYYRYIDASFEFSAEHNEKVQNTIEKCELFLIVSFRDDVFFSAVDTFAVETCKEILFHLCTIADKCEKKS